MYAKAIRDFITIFAVKSASIWKSGLINLLL